jgi:HEAT repeat protein
VWTQKSRHSTRSSIDFTVHLGAAHEPSRASYWSSSLRALIPENEGSWWTLDIGHPIEPVGEEVLAAFRAYGWPAILAALDSPGFPPDPAITWARTFQAEPSAAVRPDGKPELGPLAWVLRGRHQDGDELFADLASQEPMTRFAAIVTIGDQARDDRRTLPALLDRLASDPDARVRRWAARGLTPSARQAAVRQALEAAAAEDEDLDVRWAARYAIRLIHPAPP